MYSFFAFAFKVCKKCYYYAKENFVKNINIGINNTELYADFKIVDADLNKCRLKRPYSKNYENVEYFCFSNFLVVFCFYFFKEHFLNLKSA